MNASLCVFISEKDFLHFVFGSDFLTECSPNILKRDTRVILISTVKSFSLWPFLSLTTHTVIVESADQPVLKSDVYMCHRHISCVAQHSLRTLSLFRLSLLSSCVSAEVDRLCLALRAHGLLFWVPLDLPLVTGPVFRWKPCRAPCWQVKCSCTSPQGLKTDSQRRCLYSFFLMVLSLSMLSSVTIIRFDVSVFI